MRVKLGEFTVRPDGLVVMSKTYLNDERCKTLNAGSKAVWIDKGYKPGFAPMLNLLWVGDLCEDSLPFLWENDSVDGDVITAFLKWAEEIPFLKTDRAEDGSINVIVYDPALL